MGLFRKKGDGAKTEKKELRGTGKTVRDAVFTK